jgi:hypothetical protein
MVANPPHVWKELWATLSAGEWQCEVCKTVSNNWFLMGLYPCPGVPKPIPADVWRGLMVRRKP